jgi:effector-binding domain-containing protein
MLEKLFKELYNELLEEKELLKIIAAKLTKTKIRDEKLRSEWDNFDVKANESILDSKLVVGEDCILRVWVAFDTPGTLIAVINSQSVYLNQGITLNPYCLYVFDIPLNADDTFNLSYSVNARCLILRLQKVRVA